MDFRIRKLSEGDRTAVVDIFNHFVEYSFAAYPAKKVGYGFFEYLKETARGDSFYVIESPEAQVIGFGLLRKYHGGSIFHRAAELAYFIMPAYGNRGLGTKLLTALLSDATKMGVETVLASISSLNAASLNFHRKNGFAECGRFKRVGKKNGRDFDVIWMQRFI
ncbi:MAG: N-acetyltransferase [Ammonifex sp.]|jgi:phosphinothricin acetyltransferase|nr:MAG: N-acetyltransferase [Ammonifex sp.]